MKNLEEVLREKEKQLQDLQQEIEILRNAGRILGARVESSRNNQNRNKISQAQMIRTVLLQHDRPLHVNELRKKMKERFGTPLKNGDITSVIYRAIRRGTFFRKDGKIGLHLAGYRYDPKPQDDSAKGDACQLGSLKPVSST